MTLAHVLPYRYHAGNITKHTSPTPPEPPFLTLLAEPPRLRRCSRVDRKLKNPTWPM